MSNTQGSDESLNSYIDWLCEKADRDLCRKYPWLRRFHNPVGLRTLNPPPRPILQRPIAPSAPAGGNPVLSSRYQPFVGNREMPIEMPIEHPLYLGNIGLQMHDPSKMDLFHVPQYNSEAFMEKSFGFKREYLKPLTRMDRIRKLLGIRRLTWRISREWRWDPGGYVLYDLPSETLVIRSFGPIRYARWTNHLD